MSREIKFRVWSGNMWLDGGDANIKPVNPDETDIELISEYPHKRLIMCQYTGLKDMNGKDIYEGDIVLINGRDYFLKRYFEWNAVVEWGSYGDGEYVDNIECWIIRNITKKSMAEDDSLSDTITSKMYNVLIVGNIYENPELVV